MICRVCDGRYGGTNVGPWQFQLTDRYNVWTEVWSEPVCWRCWVWAKIALADGR